MRIELKNIFKNFLKNLTSKNFIKIQNFSEKNNCSKSFHTCKYIIYVAYCGVGMRNPDAEKAESRTQPLRLDRQSRLARDWDCSISVFK